MPPSKTVDVAKAEVMIGSPIELRVWTYGCFILDTVVLEVRIEQAGHESLIKR
jgi:hypothetical protein